MCRSPVAFVAVALTLLSAAPVLAGESGGQWSINRGANAPNVQVSVAPLPEDHSGTAPCGCGQPTVVGGAQYTFPSASGVTIYITPPAFGGYANPFAFGYGAGSGVPYGYSSGFGGAASPQVVVWASQGGGTY